MGSPTTVSLFCGAGGESLGKHLAFEELGIPTQDMQAHAMGIPSWYRFLDTAGKAFTKRDQVKMIGNMVPTGLAKALVMAVAQVRPEIYVRCETIA